LAARRNVSVTLWFPVNVFASSDAVPGNAWPLTKVTAWSNFAVPFTSSVAPGVMVPMPTLLDFSNSVEDDRVVLFVHIGMKEVLPLPVMADEGGALVLPAVACAQTCRQRPQESNTAPTQVEMGVFMTTSSDNV
jgi:hypothetical protein